MKKLSLFLLGFVATSFMASAQQIDSDMFIDPANTGANMTVGVNASKFDQFEGGQIGAFFDLDADGTLECVGLESIGIGFFGLALWGDDSSTPGPDGLNSGDVPQFAILHDGNVLLVDEIPQFTGYVTNGIVNITNAIINGGSGCSDSQACNAMFMYGGIDSTYTYTDSVFSAVDSAYVMTDSALITSPSVIYINDGSCEYESCAGCTDASACNYDETATFDNSTCAFVDGICDTCEDGTVVDNDADDDGVCDDDEVPGCMTPGTCNYSADATDDDGSCESESCAGSMDSTACNYDASATLEDGSSIYAEGCDTCSGEDDGTGFVVDNDADDDGVCDADEIVGCQNPSAPNFNPDATDDAEEGSELACESAPIAFSTPEYPAHVVTSNNMSVLFPVNNSGLWNVDESNLMEGDLVAAFYTTATLDNDFLGYSATSAIANGGGIEWTGNQVGAAIFGADNGIDNGFEPGEELMWLVLRDGVVYNASITYATPGYDGTYEENIYVSANSLIIGEPFLNGCKDSNYMEYSPMAAEDDGSCSTYISVGCLDANFVNYAGADVDADNIHDNSENFGNAFVQNYTIDLNTGAQTPSGVGANFHDVSLCQSQVPGCTYPYASNYDSQSTEDDGSCDWSAYSHHTFDAVTGVNTGTLYSFGGDDDDSNNEWVESDFEYANDLYQDARMGTGHIVTDLIASYNAYTERRKADSTFLSDTLIDVAAWFAADESADAQELADSLSDNYERFDAMHTYLSDSIQATIDSASLAWIADEIADAQELADTISDMQARYDANDLMWSNKYNDTLADVAIWFAADETADAQELADTISDMQARYDANHAAHLVLEGLITDSLNYHRAPIVIDLHTGWNTVAYYLHHESPVVAQFEGQFGSETAVQQNINIVKNNEGLFYWPDFLFDGLGMLEPGQGYQVRVKDATSGNSNFIFDHAVNRDDYRVLTPTVPAWAIEMDVENHPNDVRTLVRVVNMLGQEVVPANQFAGEVLLYMYNDGTVEKKMVE